MDEFPSNAHTKRQEPKKAAAKPEKEKLEKVVTGKVIQRKKPWHKRVGENLNVGDARLAASSVVLDVLVPAAKAMIADAGTQYIEKVIFGEVRSRPRSRFAESVVGSTRYAKMYGGGSSAPAPSSGMSRKARAQHDFSDLILETRSEAEEVINQLLLRIEKYDVATVADLYDLLDESAGFTDHQYGWMNLDGADVKRIPQGYLLVLPRPFELD